MDASRCCCRPVASVVPLAPRAGSPPPSEPPVRVISAAHSSVSPLPLTASPLPAPVTHARQSAGRRRGQCAGSRGGNSGSPAASIGLGVTLRVWQQREGGTLASAPWPGAQEAEEGIHRRWWETPKDTSAGPLWGEPADGSFPKYTAGEKGTASGSGEHPGPCTRSASYFNGLLFTLKLIEGQTERDGQVIQGLMAQRC